MLAYISAVRVGGGGCDGELAPSLAVKYKGGQFSKQNIRIGTFSFSPKALIIIYERDCYYRHRIIITTLLGW